MNLRKKIFVLLLLFFFVYILSGRFRVVQTHVNESGWKSALLNEPVWMYRTMSEMCKSTYTKVKDFIDQKHLGRKPL